MSIYQQSSILKKMFLKKIFIREIPVKKMLMKKISVKKVFKNISFIALGLVMFGMNTSAQVNVSDLDKARGISQGGLQRGIQTGSSQTPSSFYNIETKDANTKNTNPKNTNPKDTNPKDTNIKINQQAMQQKVQEKIQSAPSITPPPRNISPSTASSPPMPGGKPSSPHMASPVVKNMFFDEEVQDSTEPGTIYQNTIEVMPETTTKIDLSSIDINRVVCPVDIKDVVYSKEKGLNVKIQGKNAFMKFTVIKDDDKIKYNTVPVDMYIVCGNEVYSIIAYPKRLPAQIVRLSRGKNDIVKKNMDMFNNIPFEKKVMTILKAIFTDAIPDSFNVTTVNKPFNVFQQIDLTLGRIIMVEGEGVSIKEYIAKAKTDVYLKEKDFLRPDLTTKTVAISIGTLNLKKNETSKILIVEQRGNN